jgi:C-22 sterol desaturase
MDALNATRASSVLTSVLANSKYVSANIPPQVDYVIDTIAAAGPWTWFFTILAICVVYDQGTDILLRPLKAHSGSTKRPVS